jgi:hypothetical protein
VQQTLQLSKWLGPCYSVVPQLDPFPVTLRVVVGAVSDCQPSRFRYSPFKRNCIPKRHGISTHGSYSGPHRRETLRVLLVLESVGSGEEGKRVEVPMPRPI